MQFQAQEPHVAHGCHIRHFQHWRKFYRTALLLTMVKSKRWNKTRSHGPARGFVSQKPSSHTPHYNAFAHRGSLQTFALRCWVRCPRRLARCAFGVFLQLGYICMSPFITCLFSLSCLWNLQLLLFQTALGELFVLPLICQCQPTNTLDGVTEAASLAHGICVLWLTLLIFSNFYLSIVRLPVGRASHRSGPGPVWKWGRSHTYMLALTAGGLTWEAVSHP